METVFLPRSQTVANGAAMEQDPPPSPVQLPALSAAPGAGLIPAWRTRIRVNQRVAAVAAVATIVVVLGAVAMAQQLASRADVSRPAHPPVSAGGRDVVLLPEPPPAVALPTVIRILNPDGDGAEVKINGVHVGVVHQGSFVGEMPPGEHILELAARPPRKAPRTQIAFETVPAGLARARSLLAPEQRVVVVSTQTGRLHVQSNTPTLAVAVDGIPRGSTGADGIEVASLDVGVHELALGVGADLRRMSIGVGDGAAIDIMIFSDRNVGSLLLLTGEDNVSVMLDGRAYRARTRRGELRIANLTASSHTIAVVKAGFKPSDVRTVRIVKGQEIAVTFALTPIERMAKLLLQQVTPDAEVTVDDELIGRIAADGTLSYSAVPPGLHTIVLTKAGHETWRGARTFSVEQPVVVNDVTLALTAVAPTPVVAHVSAAPIVTAPLSAGLELLELPATWNLRDGWMIAKGGGFVLSRQRMGSGRLSFALKRAWKWTPFSNGNRINMVVGYSDSRNHVLLALDEKYYYRSEVIDGSRRQLVRVPHHLSDKLDSFQVEIQIGGGVLEFRISDGARWTALDRWTPTERPLTDGQVGFFVAGQDEVRLSNFRAEMKP
jgi:hypothetical protein